MSAPSPTQQAEELMLMLIAAQQQYPALFAAHPQLVDDLDAYTNELKAVRDGQIRSEGFRVLGATYLSIREALGLLTSRVDGYHEDMAAWREAQETTADRRDHVLLQLEQALGKREAADAGYIGAIQEVTSAVSALRTDFHRRIGALGETVSEMSQDVATLTANAIVQETLNRRVEEQLAAHGETLAAHTRDIRSLQAYAAAMPAAERQRLVALIETSERRYQEIAQQLAELRDGQARIQAAQDRDAEM